MTQGQHLRDEVAKTDALARLLFEQQFLRRGGRKPGDPTWDDLEQPERDEYWDRALDTAPLLDALKAEVQRLISELADTRGRLGETQGHLWEAREHLTLLKWLHAEVARQVERLHSWAGLMELLDEHWPADIFPDRETAAERSEDDGPRVISLIRALDAVEASRWDWATEALRLEHIAEMMTNAAAMNHDRLRFVASRYLSDGSGTNFRPSRCTGVSSDALAWYAVGCRDEPQPGEYPRDESDLAACERTYEMAPEFLRERMLPVLNRYRKYVASQCSVHQEGGGRRE